MTPSARDVGITSQQLPVMLKAMDGQIGVLQQALPQPKGMDLVWYKQIGFEPVRAGAPFPSSLYVSFYEYYCDGAKTERASGEGAVARLAIEANRYWHLTNKNGGPLGGKEVYTLGYPIGAVKGYTLYATPYNSVLGDSLRIFRWKVLVTAPGKFPFHFVTRKEVLDYLRAVTTAKRQESIEHTIKYSEIRPKAVQEAAKQRELEATEKARYSSEDARRKRVERFLKDYRTDEERRDETIARVEADYKARLAHLERVAAAYTAQQLEEPAVLRPVDFSSQGISTSFKFSEIQRDQGICETNCDLPQHLVTINEAYFDPALPRTAPQVFTVAFSWMAARKAKYRDPENEALRDRVMEAIDYDRLAALLGK